MSKRFDADLVRAWQLSGGHVRPDGEAGEVLDARGVPYQSRRSGVGAALVPPPYIAPPSFAVPRGWYGGQQAAHMAHTGGALDSAGILNTGRAVTILPAQFGGGVNAGLNEPGPEERLLELSGSDRESQALTIFFATLPNPNAGTGPFNILNTILNGPIIGIVLFSVGGGNFTRVEFDLPMPKPFRPQHDTLNLVNTSDGVSITVPASSAIALARLDSKIFYVNAALLGVTDTIAIAGFGTRNNPMQALAYAGYNFAGKGFKPLRRTIYVAGSASSLAVGAPVQFGLPNFAKRVYFHRRPLDTTTIEVNVLNAVTGSSPGPYVFGPGNIGPLELSPGLAEIMSITNLGAGAITYLAAEFELEL